MDSETMRKLRVLVVDDAATVRHQLVEMLGPLFDCQSFAEGASALGSALQQPPDFILSDVVMEPMDGYELCRRVRAEPSLRDTSFILLTSQGDPNGRAVGLEGGADDYLSKPVRLRELLARMRHLLRLREAYQEIRRQKAEVMSSHAELMRAQSQLLEAEKLSTLGTVASGLAHELNNPLAFIRSGVAQLLTVVDELADPDLAAEARKGAVKDAQEIRSEVSAGLERIGRIVRQVGLMAQDGRSPAAHLEVSEEVHRALEMAREQLHGIRIQEDFTEGCRLRIAPGYLAQMALTLISNAADAVRGAARPEIHLCARRAGDWLELEVRDNGGGIHPDLLPQVFEPFLTSKPAGRGAGLGLSVCRVLARRLGGDVTVHSSWGVGCQAFVRLPLGGSDGAGGFNRLRHAAATLGGKGPPVFQVDAAPS